MKPLNLFALIDEECFYPGGDEFSMLNKLKGIHSANELFKGKLARKNLNMQIIG